MWIIKKRLKDASISHRLGNGYEGPCKNLHGHTYHFDVEVACDELDRFDMCVDFKDLKVCCKWIQDNLDHGTLVSHTDETLHNFIANCGAKHYVMDGNTTAENIAQHLHGIFKSLLAPYPIKNLDVTVWETDTSAATYSGGVEV